MYFRVCKRRYTALAMHFTIVQCVRGIDTRFLNTNEEVIARKIEILR